MTLAHVLLFGTLPFLCATAYFGYRKGENNYYESDAYTGNGTAHSVLFEETTCERREIANGTEH